MIRKWLRAIKWNHLISTKNAKSSNFTSTCCNTFSPAIKRQLIFPSHRKNDKVRDKLILTPQHFLQVYDPPSMQRWHHLEHPKCSANPQQMQLLQSIHQLLQMLLWFQKSVLLGERKENINPVQSQQKLIKELMRQMSCLCSEILCQFSQIQQPGLEVKHEATHPAQAHEEWHSAHDSANYLLNKLQQHFHCAHQKPENW